MKIEDKTLDGSGLFISKFDSYGNLIWLRCVPGGQVQAITIDDGGNAYIAGNTSSTTVGSTTITENGTDLFAAKLTTDVATAGVVGGGLNTNMNATTFPNAIATGADGVVHVTGNFRYGGKPGSVQLFYKFRIQPCAHSSCGIFGLEKIDRKD